MWEDASSEAASARRNSQDYRSVRLRAGCLVSRDVEVMDPTNSRWQVFWALHHAIAANGHSPTVRELAEVVGLATGTVHHHLKALKLDRWID